MRRDWLEAVVRQCFEATASDELRSEFVRRLEGLGLQRAATVAEEFYREFSFIEVEDWGCGMSMNDLRTKFLTVGTPNRHLDRQRLGTASKLLGEKGIGRLSAMRLGLFTGVISGMEGERHWNTLDIDWSNLRDAPDMNLDEFSPEPERGAQKNASESGTLIRISDLQSDWSLARVTALARAEFSKLQDPFETSGAILDIDLSFNGKEVTAVEEIEAEWLNKWHGHFKMTFGYKRVNPDDEEDFRETPVLSGTAEFRLPKQPDAPEPLEVIDQKDIAASGDGLYSLLATNGYAVSGGGTAINDAPRFSGIETVGPFTAEGFWFNRQRAQQEFGDNYIKFKAWLEQWAGGLLVYRDGYRVYPYAAPDDDWLELDQRALRRKSFKLNRGQFVGYRRVHCALKDALQTACEELKADVDGMELQDFAALHVGHLIHEGEPLSDYVGWMLGQALTVKLQESVTMADASGRLPQENHRVLLGHLEPTQGIPKLFSEASTVRTASGQHHKQTTGSRELRFGDIFVGKLTRTGKKIDLTQFRLVLSQTCDLLQKKITNGQVLCAEGHGTEVPNTEVELMRATLRQLDDKGSSLIRLEDGAYYQVRWNEVNLITIEQTKLKKEQGFRYVGRLNEIYALEVQHNALNKLGRIGVPVKPGYSLVFGAVRLRVWGPKGELTALARYRDTKTVTAVLRPLPKKQVAILLSSDIKHWLVEQLDQLQEQLPQELTEFSKDLRALIKSENDFRFHCRQVGSGALELGANKEKEEKGQKVKSLEWLKKLSVELGSATVFTNPVVPAQGTRLQIEFDPIS
ncbi:hypothetical protein WK91_14760 [Burkholderia cepacia]|nr:hypothetical protein WK91_14760 [Burkholderia cepacia]